MAKVIKARITRSRRLVLPLLSRSGGRSGIETGPSDRAAREMAPLPRFKVFCFCLCVCHVELSAQRSKSWREDDQVDGEDEQGGMPDVVKQTKPDSDPAQCERDEPSRDHQQTHGRNVHAEQINLQ